MWPALQTCEPPSTAHFTLPKLTIKIHFYLWVLPVGLEWCLGSMYSTHKSCLSIWPTENCWCSANSSAGHLHTKETNSFILNFPQKCPADNCRNDDSGCCVNRGKLILICTNYDYLTSFYTTWSQAKKMKKLLNFFLMLIFREIAPYIMMIKKRPSYFDFPHKMGILEEVVKEQRPFSFTKQKARNSKREQTKGNWFFSLPLFF